MVNAASMAKAAEGGEEDQKDAEQCRFLFHELVFPSTLSTRPRLPYLVLAIVSPQDDFPHRLCHFIQPLFAFNVFGSAVCRRLEGEIR